MKKKVSLLLTAALTLQMSVALKASAATVEISSFYADVYGVTVDFKSGVDTDYTLTCGGEDIASTYETSGSTITIKPTEKLQTDTRYTLTVAGETKNFRIKTLFFEDFNDKTGTIDGQTTEMNDYGEYTVTPGSGEAFYKDGELAVNNGVFAVSNIYNTANRTNVTYMVDLKGYAKQNVGFADIYIGMRTNNPNSLNDRYVLRRQNGSGRLGIYSSSFTSQKTYSDSFGFAKLSSSEFNGDYAYDTPSAQREVALRAYKGNIFAFEDSLLKETVSDTSNIQGYFNLSANQRTLAVIDNVRVTCCVEDIEVSNVTVKTTGLDITFSSKISSIDTSKIKLYKDDATVSIASTPISGSKFTLNISGGIDANAVYDLYIESGMLNDVSYMADSYLCKIESGSVTLPDDIETGISAGTVSEDKKSVSGKYTLKNFTDTDENVNVVLVAYSDGGFMQSARILSISKIDKTKILDDTYNFSESLPITKISIFLLNSLDDLDDFSLLSYSDIDIE